MKKYQIAGQTGYYAYATDEDEQGAYEAHEALVQGNDLSTDPEPDFYDPGVFEDFMEYARTIGDPDAFGEEEDTDPEAAIQHFRSSINDLYESDESEDQDSDMDWSTGNNNNSMDNDFSLDGLDRDIIANESGGDYTADATKRTGVPAIGKYQFVWTHWGNEIAKVTGIKDKEDFKNSPEAQEAFYNHYKKTYMMPYVLKRLRDAQEIDPDITAEELAKMFHYGGPGNVDKAIYKKKSFDWIPGDKSNTKTLKSYAKRQTGGKIGKYTTEDGIPIANSPYELYHGLNIPELADAGQLILQRGGLIRGLDSGQPVFVSNGRKSKVLIGPDDMINLSPKLPVYEKLIK